MTRENYEKEVAFAVQSYVRMATEDLIKEIKDGGSWDLEALQALASRYRIDTYDCEDCESIADLIEKEAGIDLY